MKKKKVKATPKSKNKSIAPKTKRPVKTVAYLKDADIYQKDTLILSDVNLNIQIGEFIYLIGRTGTGKTSLLRTLYADLPLQKQGEGIVVGFDLRKMTWKESPFLRRKIGIVFQDFQLLNDRNVENNLRFALEATDWTEPELIQQRIDFALEQVGISHKRDSMPYELSGGEQQRVSIARALLNEPELILADEPTGNLDPQTSFEIMTLLKSISDTGNTAILIGTHDLHTIKKFKSRVITCVNGQLLEKENTTFSN